MILLFIESFIDPYGFYTQRPPGEQCHCRRFLKYKIHLKINFDIVLDKKREKAML